MGRLSLYPAQRALNAVLRSSHALQTTGLFLDPVETCHRVHGPRTKAKQPFPQSNPATSTYAPTTPAAVPQRQYQNAPETTCKDDEAYVC